MKVCMFHLMPYRDLPADFEQRYKTAYIDPLWFDVADAEKVGQYYNATLDELLHAAKAGLHGVCTNQHHQNAYGFMANPSLMGAVLARQTAGQNVAIIQLGSTLPSTSPPTRIAEEYAMLDCISGGRLVAGFPTGLPTDATISNGVVPVEQRERYREALALVTKAWSAKEIFAWNGRHYQLGMVNLWPRPIQQPHPPIWIPGSGISSTAEYVVGLDHCFCHLSYYGARNAETVADRYWELVARKGRDDNPFRYSFLQLIGVAETDAEAEDRYAAHAEYFFNKLLYTPAHYQQIPGCLEYPALVQALQNNPRAGINLRELKAKDFFDRGFVIVGSPRTVREQLMEGMTRLRVGHLLALLHFGSMPTELCKQNIDLFAREVLPHLEGLWEDKYEDRWWPERLRAKRPVCRHGRRLVRLDGDNDVTAPEVRRLRLWQDRVETDVEITGSGPPVVYLHGPWGLGPDRAFLARLAVTNTVYAPRHPGTSKDNSEAVHALDSWLDLVVYYGELLDRLALDAPAFIGHSFGGLVAAEFAAAVPKSVSRLVLIDPVGLWRDDLPVKNWMVLSDSERRPSLFADPDGDAAARFFAVPKDAAERVDTLAQFIWAQACTGKFVWPIPDRGFRQRAHRIAAPTLVIWGKADRIIAPDYAQEFATRIAGARVELIDKAGHLPQLEQPDAVANAVHGFLGS